MSDLLTSINALFASSYPYVPRANSTANNPPRSDFARDLAGGELKPGTTVTQQTRYTVDNNGRLQKTGSQVTIGDQQEIATPFLPAVPFSTPAPSSLAALSRPKPQLAPSDEAQLFDADSIEGGINGQARRFFDQAGAEDENGDTVEVEVIAPEVADRELPTVVSQKQAGVSYLYARNNDIVYNVEPQFAFAA